VHIDLAEGTGFGQQILSHLLISFSKKMSH